MEELKPALGLRPRFIAEENRILEIIGAISRYIELRRKIPKYWRKELNFLLKKRSK